MKNCDHCETLYHLGMVDRIKLGVKSGHFGLKLCKNHHSECEMIHQ